MGLSNVQYDEIMRRYEKRRDSSRHQANERKAYIYEHVKGYKELDDDIPSFCVEQAKKFLNGDDSALVLSKSLMKEKINAKETLLIDSGYRLDYLLPEYECPDCQDTAYIGTQKCHCFKQAIINLLYEQSGIKEMIERENFSHLKYDYYSGEDLERFKRAVAICKDFCNHEYQNIFFYGTVGTGKSFLSGCIAKTFIDSGHSVIYYTATDFFNTISQHTFDFSNKDELRALRTDLCACDLLIIDDLGTEFNNNFTISQLFSCLNMRHLNRKATIISTNLSLEEFKMRYSERIFSRITSNYELLYLSGQDIRMIKKRKARLKTNERM